MNIEALIVENQELKRIIEAFKAREEALKAQNKQLIDDLNKAERSNYQGLGD